MPPSQASCRGKWDAKTCGGCPKNANWTENPQFLLLPEAAGTFNITLRCNAAPKLDIGFVVLKQEAKDAAGRKTTSKVRKAELISKTKWKNQDQVSLEVELPDPAGGGKGFLVIPCTFEPGPQAGFELQAVNASGAPFTLTPIGDENAPVVPTFSAASATATKPAAAAQPGVVKAMPQGVEAGAFTGAAGYAAPDMTPTSGPVAEGEVEIKSEGQGLSAKQKKEAAELIQKAVDAAGSGLYTDPDFPASPSSVWINGSGPGGALQQAGIGAEFVQSWRRPSEIAAGYPDDGPARLFYTDWGVQGVVASPLLNHWLLAACNIVGGDVEILERVFVDMEHADKGFYVVRFYIDDPNSDDDWKVILVDDYLPCGADGLPCFARCPAPTVFWVAILEKAFAKLKGCYEATGGGSVEDGLLYLTGGLSREVGIAPSNDPHMLDALWAQMMEWWTTSHVIGCEHRIDGEPSAELQATGLLPNTPYCVVTGGEPSGAGRMVRLRTFHGYSEWTGKWSDNDPNWTSRLRQSLAYSNNTDDGTFWMAFNDFVIWFNVLFTCRMADDRWTTLITKSKWQDESAGGCPPNFATWRCNPQWLLRTSQHLRLTVSISVPQPPPPADGSAAPLFSPEASIGVSVLLGNGGADARRRKLLLQSPEELVVRAEPRPVRRLVTQIELEPSETPYIVIPHTYMPGKEMPFTLSLRADDVNDDGVADFTFEPIRGGTDWHHASKMVVWANALSETAESFEEEGEGEEEVCMPISGAAGGPPGSPGFISNPQIELKAEKAGRFYVFLDQIGANPNESYPEIGGAVVPDPAAFEDGTITNDELLLHEKAQASDSVMFVCELEASETPYCIMPYLSDPNGAKDKHPQLAVRVSVYSDAPFSIGGADTGKKDELGAKCGIKPDGSCICWGYGKYPSAQNESLCIVLRVHNSLKRMERGMERQLKYLDTLMPAQVHEKMKS